MGVLELVYAWMVGFMVVVAPPGRTTFYVEAQESREEALARYESIAKDVTEVVYDPETKPLFAGPQGRTRTATVVLAIMLHEGGFMKNVDTGVGKFARGDNGRSWCLMQINVGTGKTPDWNKKLGRVFRPGDAEEDRVPGLTGQQLVDDRKNCIRQGLRVLRVSFNSCPGLPLDQKLRVYGSGNCNGAVEGSRVRMNSALKFWERTKEQRLIEDGLVKRSFTDVEVQEALRRMAPTPPTETPQIPVAGDKVATQ